MDRGVALVTGASGDGIGRHAASALRAAGFRVWAGARRAEALEKLQQEGLEAVRLDLTDDASLVGAVAKVGCVDVLVNNAAYGLLGPIEGLDLEEFRREMETNLFGLVRLTQLVLPGMREASAGRIVNVGSIGGRVTTPLGGAYHASKFALEAITDALRLETRGFGVRVSIIEPGIVSTGFMDKATEALEVSSESPYAGMVSAYRPVLQRAYAGGYGAIPPERVARAIVHAATARHPRTRYRSGLQAKALNLLRHLTPDELWDAAQSRLLRP